MVEDIIFQLIKLAHPKDNIYHGDPVRRDILREVKIPEILEGKLTDHVSEH